MSSKTPPERLQGKNEQHGLWLMRRIWDRVNRDNEHFMGVIVGREGSGKSHTAIKISNEIDPSFTADRVIFEVTDLLKRLRDDEHESGNFYVLDEAGVQLGRRTWQERSQILANQALQLIRDHNLGLVFTLPRLGEFDSQSQGRLQAALELTEKEPDKYVRGKWKWFQPDRMDETGKIYKKYPRRRVDGSMLRIQSFSFSPPNDAIVSEYETRKAAFQNKFYTKVIDEVEGEPESDEDEVSAKEIATELADGNLDAIVAKDGRDGSPIISADLIRVECDVTVSEARAIKAMIERDKTTTELEKYL